VGREGDLQVSAIRVENAEFFPHRDAVTGNEKGPFVDLGLIYVEPGEIQPRRIYLSEETVRELAQTLGILNDPELVRKARTAGYVQGKLDAVKEGLPDVARRAADLGALAASLS